MGIHDAEGRRLVARIAVLCLDEAMRLAVPDQALLPS